MRPIIYIRPRTAWLGVKVLAWLVVFTVLSAHRGNGAAVFLFASLGYLVLKAWTRSRNRRPVPEEPPERHISEDEAMWRLRGAYQLWLDEQEKDPPERPDEPQQIRARRTP